MPSSVIRMAYVLFESSNIDVYFKITIGSKFIVIYHTSNGDFKRHMNLEIIKNEMSFSFSITSHMPHVI